MNASKHLFARARPWMRKRTEEEGAVAHIGDSDDNAVLFGYFPASESASVYECSSAFIVVQETAHAVLDGLRHLYEESALSDQPAIDEAFADIVALLSALVADPSFGWRDPLISP